MMKTSRATGLLCGAAFMTLALPALAQTAGVASSPFAPPQAGQVQPPSAGGDNLGDHIATQVLNMNGLNITNLNDPFSKAMP